MLYCFILSVVVCCVFVGVWFISPNLVLLCFALFVSVFLVVCCVDVFDLVCFNSDVCVGVVDHFLGFN